MDNSQKYCPCGADDWGADPAAYPTRNKRHETNGADIEGAAEGTAKNCRRTKKEHRGRFEKGFSAEGTTCPQR